jgi:general secretion pathway protein K
MLPGTFSMSGRRAMREERGRPPCTACAKRIVRASAEHPRSPGRALRAYPSERGIALILVLWLTILLTVIAAGFAYSMRTEALAARNAVALAQARALADGAVSRVAFELMRPRMLGETWQADGAVHNWDEGEASIAANAVDESGNIDLNAASEVLLRGLFQTAGGVDADTAARLVDAIGDWKDADDLRRPNGAEAPEYQAAGLSYKPANGPFETVAELQRVLGMTPALYAAVAGSLTIFSRQAGINPAFASRTVLLALPNATPEIVDAYIAQRSDALKNRQPLPAFPLAAVGAAPINVWRIRAEVTTSDGATFIREAVIRPGGDALHPVTVLMWQEGDRRVFAPPPAPQ